MIDQQLSEDCLYLSGLKHNRETRAAAKTQTSGMFSIPPITPIALIAVMLGGGVCIVEDQLDIAFISLLCRETIICSLCVVVCVSILC